MGACFQGYMHSEWLTPVRWTLARMNVGYWLPVEPATQNGHGVCNALGTAAAIAILLTASERSKRGLKKTRVRQIEEKAR